MQALHDALRKGIEADSFKQFARDQVLPLAYQSPKELGEQLRRDFAIYGDILAKLNLLAK